MTTNLWELSKTVNGGFWDVNQITDALSGNNDVGQISAFAQISAPGAPTVAVNTSTGNLTGNYQYAVAYLTGYLQGDPQNPGAGTLHTQGNTGGGTASAVVSPSGQQVNLSNIPVGGTGVVARVLYRTKADGSSFFFLQQINDNTTTSWTDNIADASLGAAMPTTNTTGTKFSGDGSGLTKLPLATSSQPGAVKPTEGLILDPDGTLKAPWSVKGLSSVLSPSRQSFTRSTPAGQVNGTQVASNVLRLEQGRFHKAPFIEESTVNLVPNSGFNTVTGTAQVFADALTSYTGSTVPAPWTNQSGSWTFGASGATSGASGSLMIAGNSNWKPLTGSGGQSLTEVVQATFVEGTTVGNQNLFLFQDANNNYVAYTQGSVFYLGKHVSGAYTTLASVGQTISASTTYTITLLIDASGNLTAKLYSGQGTGGTLLQTLTHQDTSLTGPFLIGVGGDTGVIVSHAQVNAPFADGWTISGESRVAVALTSNAISGTYSLSTATFNGANATQIISTNGTTVTGNSTYSVSAFFNNTPAPLTGCSANVGVAWYDGTTTYISQDNSTAANSLGISRKSASVQAPSNAATAKAGIWINANTAAGTFTFVFDMVQLEQKAYATTYIENNNATAGSTAARNADSLSYTLDKPLASRWSASFAYKPQNASSVQTRVTQIAYFATLSGSVRYSIAYNNTAGEFNFSKNIGGTWYTAYSSAISFSAGDTVWIEVVDDPTTGNMFMWVSVNNGTIQQFSLADTHTISDAQIVYLGAYGTTTGYEANGTIECILHPLASGETVTTDEVTALFGASDWGLGDYPSALPDKVQIGNGTILRSDGRFENPNGGFAIMASGSPNITQNCHTVDGTTWNRYDTTKSATLITIDGNGSLAIYYAQAGSNPISWTVTDIPLAQVLSGGYKIQSGNGVININTANTWIAVTVVFPQPFSTTPLVIPGSNSGYGNGTTFGITAVNATPTQVTIEAQSNNTIGSLLFDWVAIG